MGIPSRIVSHKIQKEIWKEYMEQGAFDTLSQPNKLRIAIAREIVERTKQELGEHLRAACCYGSVAHQAAGDYSDVEMILITDETIQGKEELFFAQGIMVECDTRSTSRLLRAARQQVSKRWGVEADQYRHHLVLLDLDDFFPQLWEVARNIPASAFAEALPTTWWWCYEVRNKLLNACAVNHGPRMRSEGWGFAQASAMHIALYEQCPYESGRTLWQDVTARGYGMRELVDILTVGTLSDISLAVDEVWKQISQWGAPESERQHSSPLADKVRNSSEVIAQ